LFLRFLFDTHDSHFSPGNDDGDDAGATIKSRVLSVDGGNHHASSSSLPLWPSTAAAVVVTSSSLIIGHHQRGRRGGKSDLEVCLSYQVGVLQNALLSFFTTDDLLRLSECNHELEQYRSKICMLKIKHKAIPGNAPAATTTTDTLLSLLLRLRAPSLQHLQVGDLQVFKVLDVLRCKCPPRHPHREEGHECGSGGGDDDDDNDGHYYCADGEYDADGEDDSGTTVGGSSSEGGKMAFPVVLRRHGASYKKIGQMMMECQAMKAEDGNECAMVVMDGFCKGAEEAKPSHGGKGPLEKKAKRSVSVTRRPTSTYFMRELMTMEISGCQLSYMSGRRVGRALNTCRNLRALLFSNITTCGSVSGLVPIMITLRSGSCPALVELQLNGISGGNTTAQEVWAISSVLSSGRLDGLERFGMTGSHTPLLQVLLALRHRQWHHLRRLDLSHNSLRDPDCLLLSDWIRDGGCYALQDLRLMGTACRPFLPIMQALHSRSCLHLKHLALETPWLLLREEVDALANALESFLLHHIRSLTFSCIVPMTDKQSIKMVTALIRGAPQLRVLKASLPSSSLAAAAAVLHGVREGVWPHLEVIDVRGISLPMMWVCSLASAITMGKLLHLRELGVRLCTVEEAHSLIEALKSDGCPRLRQISLQAGGNWMDDGSFKTVVSDLCHVVGNRVQVLAV